MWGHGLTSSRAAEDASPLVDWSGISAEVTRYDARGHGESASTPNNDEYSWESLAHDQLALADELGIDTYIAGGASMGCGTALHAAVMAPERVTALVLVIPPTAWEVREAQADQWGAAAHVATTKGVEPIIAARREVAPPDPYVDDPNYRARYEANLRSWDVERLAQVFRGATSADLPPREAISAITCPTLILAWTGDPTHPQSTADQLHELISGSELHLASTSDQLRQWTDHVAAFVAAR